MRKRGKEDQRGEDVKIVPKGGWRLLPLNSPPIIYFGRNGEKK